MSLSPRLRWTLAATLAASAAVAFFTDEPSPALPVSRKAVTGRASPGPATWRVAGAMPWPTPPAARPASRWRDPPPAALAAWGTAPPPPASSVAAASQAASPSAPVFPYSLMGRIEEDGVTRAVLQGARRSVAAAAGDLLDGQWRIDEVRDDGLVLTWLPGDRRHTVSYRSP